MLCRLQSARPRRRRAAAQAGGALHAPAEAPAGAPANPRTAIRPRAAIFQSIDQIKLRAEPGYGLGAAWPLSSVRERAPDFGAVRTTGRARAARTRERSSAPPRLPVCARERPEPLARSATPACAADRARLARARGAVEPTGSGAAAFAHTSPAAAEPPPSRARHAVRTRAPLFARTADRPESQRDQDCRHARSPLGRWKINGATVVAVVLIFDRALPRTGRRPSCTRKRSGRVRQCRLLATGGAAIWVAAP